MRLEPIPSQAESRGLETVSFYAIEVEAQRTQEALKLLTKHYPLERFEFVKRARRKDYSDKKSPLQLLITQVTPDGTAASMANSLNKLNPPGLFTGEITTVQVSKYPAVTPEQQKLFNECWPISFHQNMSKRTVPLAVGDEELSLVWMQQVIRMSEANDGVGAGILVNPESNSEVLRCLGKTDHPLRHCVMVIAGELGKLPCLSDEDEPLDHKTKRARHELQQDDAPTLSAGDSRAASAASESAAVERRTDGYIMSDLDLYLSHEPCVMCSMALVHSRVSRLFYAKDFPERGAIGSGWGIHQHPGLNHHYKAFKAIKGPR